MLPPAVDPSPADKPDDHLPLPGEPGAPVIPPMAPDPPGLRASLTNVPLPPAGVNTDAAIIPLATAEIKNDDTIPLAQSTSAASAVPRAGSTARLAKTPAPKLAIKPVWPTPEEPKGRRFLATMVMIVVIGLYAWMLSIYNAGAHGGVDQAGYLMTARLIAGEYNVDAPRTVARGAATKPAVAADKGPAVWQGGATGYVQEVHPQPASIQADPRWDWLRNRLSYVPSSPFEFASRMCIITEPYGPATPDLPPVGGKAAVAGKPAEYRVYAKYPFGFSLLAALGREVDSVVDKKMIPDLHLMQNKHTNAPEAVGPERATTGAETTSAPAAKPAKIQFERVGRGLDGEYAINPICTVLACVFAYFMFRQAVTSFMAIIGVIWLACNPLVLVYANDANSHASSLCFVCMGMWGVLSFLRTQQMWRAWVGGLALGYCCTIRYAEFLLVLPVTFAAVVHFRFTWRRALGSLSLLAAWAIPVCALAFVCWIAFGSPTKTGYTYCNEDTGFGWKYLTGNWEDREVTGNWETLVTQINRLGLFLMWPMAVAGLLGMIGSAWRLGVTVALWIIPTISLYMLYYWAPGGDLATGYLRFYVSVMPGLIFAGVWLLDRALSYIPGEKWPGRIIGTALAAVLLVAVAFYADGGPIVIDGGLGKMIAGMFKQLPLAVGHLFAHSVLGFVCGAVIVGLGAGMWILDRKVIATRMGVALGAGVITALGCAINVETIMPTVDRNFANETALRVTVDNLRETLPRGSVIICDDNLLQQLDCVGGWKLYNAAAFQTALYNQSITKLAQRNTPEHLDDPDPLQGERSQFYKELLTMPSSVAPSIGLGVRQPANLMDLERAVIDENLALGHRVTFLLLTDPGDSGITGVQGGGMAGGRVQVPEGYEIRTVRKWTISAPPSGPVTAGAQAAFGAGGRGGRGGGRGGAGGGGRGGRGNNGAGIGQLLNPQAGVGGPGGAAGGPGGGAAGAVQEEQRQGPTYTLVEVVKPAVRGRAEGEGTYGVMREVAEGGL